ncbi:ABC transporter ATP-binding protein [Pseudoclavibacter sp. RFBJ3]|nr:ABC transporter ATP-binding protein [Pseudoclavibacter sp. RFBJ5]PPF91796.1 ABC transporter ATP-binding protein [Pseudoclavibacter sp. RFBJ3]PPF95559.1 ABC transporter ATP-binding protein [Pseudoclavibacter sp. RFBH5]PPG19674.1 ABC transporter ATP-binding protein [Pseudoclavibacter sp. RFBI4]
MLLSVRDLCISYGIGGRAVDAVRGVSFELYAGEVLAVVGESGSGKSTVAHALINLLAPNATVTSGEIKFDGEPIQGFSDAQWRGIRGRRIGLVPQDPALSLNPTTKVGAQVAEPLLIHGLASRKDAHAEAVRLLDMAGLTEPAARAQQYPHEFSGGMKQRALIATALAGQPEMVIADEPTSALDVTVQKQILDHIDSLVQELGTAVLMITHDLGVAADRADRIIVMRKGEIVETGTADDVMLRPQHDYTKKLLRAAPSLHSHEARTVLVTDKAMGRAAGAVTGAAAGAKSGQAADARAGAPDISSPLLRVENLTKEFALPGGRGGKKSLTAVDNMSFDLHRGETLAVVGESGSGKSTTARLVLRLEKPTSGRIVFDDQDITDLEGERLRALRRRFQMVYQSPYASLNPRFSIEQLIAEPLVSFKLGDSKSRAKRVRELLDQVALPQLFLNRGPDELSGGQRQRVAIARALALEPEFIVLDEAVSALDVSVQAQILDLLTELQQENDLTYLFITHDLAVVAQISDRVAVMKNGVLVELGKTGDILMKPQEPYTRKLIDAIPGHGSSHAA